MITVDLNDKHLKENLEAINEIRKSGLYTDAELQEMYDKQVEADKRSDTNDRT